MHIVRPLKGILSEFGVAGGAWKCAPGLSLGEILLCGSSLVIGTVAMGVLLLVMFFGEF